jgi:histidinol-phosphate aminotransferase
MQKVRTAKRIRTTHWGKHLETCALLIDAFSNSICASGYSLREGKQKLEGSHRNTRWFVRQARLLTRKSKAEPTAPNSSVCRAAPLEGPLPSEIILKVCMFRVTKGSIQPSPSTIKLFSDSQFTKPALARLGRRSKTFRAVYLYVLESPFNLTEDIAGKLYEASRCITNLIATSFSPSLVGVVGLCWDISPPKKHLANNVEALMSSALKSSGDDIHAKVFSARHLQSDSRAEQLLHSPLALYPPFYPEISRYEGGSIETYFGMTENPLGAGKRVLDEIRLASRKTIALYPDPRYRKLRNALSTNLQLPADSFSFANGSSEMLLRILRVFTQEGDEVLTTDPTWFLFDRMCRMCGRRPRKVEYRLSSGASRAELPFDQMAQSLTRNTRLVYIVNPSNPLGATLDRVAFETFLSQVPIDIPIVVDEAYIEFSHQSGTLRLNSLIMNHPHLLVGVRTFSKWYGMANLRIGYAYARPENAELISRLELPFPISTSAEAAATAALQDTAHALRVRALIEDGRHQIISGLSELGITPLDSGAPFLMAKSPASPAAVYSAMRSHKIELPEQSWGPYLQLPIGTFIDNEKYLQVLSRLVRGAKTRQHLQMSNIKRKNRGR